MEDKEGQSGILPWRCSKLYAECRSLFQIAHSIRIKMFLVLIRNAMELFTVQVILPQEVLRGY